LINYAALSSDELKFIHFHWFLGKKERKKGIVCYHIAASGWIITGNRIQYMIHEIQQHTALREYVR